MFDSSRSWRWQTSGELSKYQPLQNVLLLLILMAFSGIVDDGPWTTHIPEGVWPMIFQISKARGLIIMQPTILCNLVLLGGWLIESIQKNWNIRFGCNTICGESTCFVVCLFVFAVETIMLWCHVWFTCVSEKIRLVATVVTYYNCVTFMGCPGLSTVLIIYRYWNWVMSVAV